MLVKNCRTVEPRLNEPLYSEDINITSDILRPSNSKMYEKVPRYKPLYSEQILSVPWSFVVSRFHCTYFVVYLRH